MAISSEPPRARESHGREPTTTPDAATCYRSAQAQCQDKSRLLAALRRAVRADPGFAVAVADLSALDGGHPTPAIPSLLAWERHHMEVVAEAAGGNARRAVDMLREHLTVVACDPIATAVVLGSTTQEPVGDILHRLPGCHCPTGDPGIQHG